MVRRKGKKRSHDEYREDGQLGVGQTLSELNGDLKTPSSPQEDHAQGNTNHGGDDSGDWQLVESSSTKKRKKIAEKGGEKYPSIAHSSHSRLQSYVKVSDLQNLVLYLLADGTAPQWCSVKNRGQVRKVVVLMVPGLESGMFDGSIPLSSSSNNEDPYTDGKPAPDSSELEQKDNESSSNKHAQYESTSQPRQTDSQTTNGSPDDYYPTRLEFDKLSVPLKPLSGIFEHVWPVKAPGDDKYSKMFSPMAGMLISPIVKPKEDKNIKGPKPPSATKTWQDKRTRITELVASTEELLEEGYVLHPAHYKETASAANEVAKRQINHQAEANGWVDTPGISDLPTGMVPESKCEKGSILAGMHVLCMDCEMCITSPAGTIPPVFSLTRISLVDWDGKVVLDEYVKPAEPITDYLTPYSGITAEKLEDVTTSLQDIQNRLLEEFLKPNTILVGHSLNSDLNALRLTHPYIADTALLYPHPRGPPLKSSLKWLAQKYLSRPIQQGHGSTGHDSIEDARACLDLVKQKCEKGKTWGTPEASGESIFKRLASQIRPKRAKLHPDGDDEPVTGAVVDWGEPSRGYGAAAKVTVGCKSDEEAVAGVQEVLVANEDGRAIPERGVDFVFARLRGLEAYQGWWNRTKTNDNTVLLDDASSSTLTADLSTVTSQTVAHIAKIWEELPPCTAFIVFSGSGDPRDLARMQEMHKTHQEEYKVKKWDELSVKWTDNEQQELKDAAKKARKGVGFIAIK